MRRSAWLLALLAFVALLGGEAADEKRLSDEPDGEILAAVEVEVGEAG